MLRGWVQGTKAALNASTTSLDSPLEQDALKQTMDAATFIMNDDLEGAERYLEHGDSSFHRLGKGLITFLRAALGFEKEIMRQAATRLAAAEAQAWSDQKRAQKDPKAFRSEIYEPGAEFALCHAQCQLMSAVVGVLNESLTESLKGFYNLRKAMMTLNRLVESETTFLRQRSGDVSTSASGRSVFSRSNTMNSTSVNPTTPSSRSGIQNTGPSPLKNPISGGKDVGRDWEVVQTGDNSDQDDDGDAFFDTDEGHQNHPTTQTYEGHIELNGSVKNLSSTTPNTSSGENTPARTTDSSTLDPMPLSDPTVCNIESSIPYDLEEDVFAHPVDEFVHSGANLCLGVLLLMLSMIPPAFGKLLSIVGFRGDRERGLRMLWQASGYHNIHGAMSALNIFVFYNGIIGFCDIIPEANPQASDDARENFEGYPLHRLKALLVDMRTRYPQSGLWKLEEARMLASRQRLDLSIPLLTGGTPSPLQQINALTIFERALQAMFSHRYQLCAESIVECCKLNNWSHALYYYIAGIAHVELYRTALDAGDEKTAEKEAEKAAEYFGQVRGHAGKRKFMTKQMPFDTFVTRKVGKWEARAVQWNISMIEAIGVSPLEEMVYFWNGYRKMNESMLLKSLENLGRTEDPARNLHWAKEGLDEKAILATMKGAVFRTLGRYSEAKEVLKTQVICHSRHLFKGELKDDWTCPVAHYEMAVNLWLERDRGAAEGSQANKLRIREAAEWIEKVRAWDGYIMDTRIGMKVTTAVGTLRKWQALHDI